MIREFSKEKLAVTLFQKRVGFLVFFLLAFYFNESLSSNFFSEKVCNPSKVGIEDYTLSKGIKGV